MVSFYLIIKGVYKPDLVSYVDKQGELKQSYDCSYINTKDLYNTNDDKGFIPVVSSLDLSSFSPSDSFQELPAIYLMQEKIKSRRRFGKKVMSRSFFASEFKNSINFFGSSDSKDFDPNVFLCLGASYKSFEIEDRQIKGLKLFAISPFFDNDDGFLGHPIIEPFLPVQKPSLKWKDLHNLPAYYRLEFRDVRGRGGEAIPKVDSINYVKPLDLKSCVVPKAA